MNSADRVTAEIDGLKIYLDGRLSEHSARITNRRESTNKHGNAGGKICGHSEE